MSRKSRAVCVVGSGNLKGDPKDSNLNKNMAESVDQDYFEFLRHMDQLGVTEKVDNDNDGDDPDYMMFLDNTLRNGASFVTTFEDNGLSLFIEYGKEGECSGELKDANARKGRRGVEKDSENLKERSNVKRQRVLRSDTRNREISMLEEDERPMSGEEHECNMKNNSDKEQRTLRSDGEEEIFDKDYELALQCMKCEGHILKALFPNNQYVEYGGDDFGDVEGGTESGDGLGHNDVNDNDYDPHYRIFLYCTEQKGTSYVTKIEENGLILFFHYEIEGGSSDEPKDSQRREVNNTGKGDKVEGKKLEELKGKSNAERSNVLRSDMETREIPMLEDEMSEPLNPVARGRKQLSGIKYEYNMKNNSDKQHRTSGTGGERKNDCADPGDDDVIEIVCATFCNGGNFDGHAPTPDYVEKGDTFELLYRNEHYQFRQKIISILQRPYDQAEYTKLLEDVNVRKPVERDLELRSGKCRSTNKFGKSYLDRFTDFSRKLDEVNPNKHKMLNLLRGFFFWLQNVTQEGSFKPWHDPKCLGVMPGSRD